MYRPCRPKPAQAKSKTDSGPYCSFSSELGPWTAPLLNTLSGHQWPPTLHMCHRSWFPLMAPGPSSYPLMMGAACSLMGLLWSTTQARPLSMGIPLGKARELPGTNSAARCWPTPYVYVESGPPQGLKSAAGLHSNFEAYGTLSTALGLHTIRMEVSADSLGWPKVPTGRMDDMRLCSVPVYQYTRPLSCTTQPRSCV